jgi:hypothetical protein
VKCCKVVRVLLSQEQAGIRVTLGDRCATLWNAVNFRCRQAFLQRDPLPSHAALCAAFQDHPADRALPAAIGQGVLKKRRKAAL